MPQAQQSLHEPWMACCAWCPAFRRQTDGGGHSDGEKSRRRLQRRRRTTSVRGQIPVACLSVVHRRETSHHQLRRLVSDQRSRRRSSRDIARLTPSLPDIHHQARLLVVSAPHSDDWLHALPISSCGLRLDDEAVGVAVGLRLGTNLCEPHQCSCGAKVDPGGTHGLACKRSAGRITRHHALNDLVWRALG